MAIDSIPSSDSFLYNTENRLQQANQSAASGLRINNSADDPSGQAIMSAFTVEIGAQDMAVRNASTGINLIQTADAASQSINEQLQSLNALSQQAMNGTYSNSQRDMLNQAFQQGMESLNQMADTTQFNGINLLNAETASIQIALDDTETTLTLPNLTLDGLGLSGASLDSPDQAAAAQQRLQDALGIVTESQSQFGAQQNGLTASIDAIASENINTQAARSQISDADMARVFSEQNRQQVLANASVAMQAQGNQSYENVLSLLAT